MLLVALPVCALQETNGKSVSSSNVGIDSDGDTDNVAKVKKVMYVCLFILLFMMFTITASKIPID